MTFAQAICGAALLASAAAASAASPSNSNAADRTSGIVPVSASVRLEYTDFTKLYGDRTVLTADSRLGAGRSTRVHVGVSTGVRRVPGVTIHGTQARAAVTHDWSDRLTSHTYGGLASNGSIFAKSEIGQDLSYELGGGFVVKAGGKYATYGNHTDVTTWSAGAAYYTRGATFSYRFSLIDSNRFGQSNAHLASVRVKDGRGSGYTQLWLGHGSSLYEADLPRSPAGKFTSVAVKRSQPIGGGFSVDVGANQAWYRTPNGNYRGTGAVAGLSFSK
jgi:YaiO family outer membrane protein